MAVKDVDIKNVSATGIEVEDGRRVTVDGTVTSRAQCRHRDQQG